MKLISRPPKETRGTLWAKNHRPGMLYHRATVHNTKIIVCAYNLGGDNRPDHWHAGGFVVGSVRVAAIVVPGGAGADAVRAVARLLADLKNQPARVADAVDRANN